MFSVTAGPRGQLDRAAGRGPTLRAMFDIRPVGYVPPPPSPIGLLTVVMGGAMLFPMALDLADGNPNWQAFAVSAGIAVMLGLSVALSTANYDLKQMSVRAAFLLTTSTWVVLPMVGSMPFLLGAPDVGLTDAYFESGLGHDHHRVDRVHRPRRPCRGG